MKQYSIQHVVPVSYVIHIMLVEYYYTMTFSYDRNHAVVQQLEQNALELTIFVILFSILGNSVILQFGPYHTEISLYCSL